MVALVFPDCARAEPDGRAKAAGITSQETSVHGPDVLHARRALGAFRLVCAVLVDQHELVLDPLLVAALIFQAADHYITPSWYPTKRETGKVVPTWNYATVHAWGAPRVIQDPDWIRKQVEALTRMQETPRAEPWAVSDAPEPFVASQLRGIVGIEIPIARIEGKWKVSQNRPPADRAGVRDGLAAEGPSSQDMARLVGAHVSPPGKS